MRQLSPRAWSECQWNCVRLDVVSARHYPQDARCLGIQGVEIESVLNVGERNRELVLMCVEAV